MSHPSTTQVEEKAPRATPGRVQRLKRRRRISLVVLIGLALTLTFGVGKALAWTAGVSPSTDCKGTTFNGRVGDELGSHTATVTFNGESKSATVPAEGGNSFTLHFNSHDGGPWSYRGTWSESSEVERQRGELSAVTDCQPTTTTSPPTTTPPTTAPPVKEKPKPVFHGTATDKKRTPPAMHRREPNPDDSIPVTPKQPTMGALPFTGPEHEGRLSLLQATALLGMLLFAIAATAFAGSRRFKKGVKQG